MPDINFNSFADKFIQYVQNAKNSEENSEIKLDEKTFKKEIINDSSIFKQLDINGDGNVTEQEFYTLYVSDGAIDGERDGIVTDKERKEFAMQQAKYCARRNIDKWFSFDVNRDGVANNAEWAMSENRMNEHWTGLDARLSSSELAIKYGTDEAPSEGNIEYWMDIWTDYIKNDVIKEQYGIELNESDMILLKKEMIKQLNTWLMKDGDNNDSPLYCQCNATAYTRLMTQEQSLSCCGGDINTPPMASQPVINEKGEVESTGCSIIFSGIEKEGAVNSASEVKNRLAWAMFPTKSQKEQAEMTPEEYEAHQEDWQNMRNMNASDFRELLKPENSEKKVAFEEHSYMSVEQIVHYIDIVEEVTGQNWDDENWSITPEQFYKISEKVNGTDGDATRLDGKTRNDIPHNRQDLLHLLEEKGWLFEQFK